MSLQFSPNLSLSLFLHLSLSLSLFFFFSTSLSFSLCLYLSVCLPFYRPISLSLSLALSLPLYLHLHFHLYHSMAASISISVSFSIPYLSVRLNEKEKLCEPSPFLDLRRSKAKRSKSARLPYPLDVTMSKTTGIPRDFLNFRTRQHQKRSNAATLSSKMKSGVLK